MAAAAPDHWKEGCEHYKRNCKLLTPCCDNIYSCRFCHDEKENHTLVKGLVKLIICNSCASLQPIKHYCERCGERFGKYVCLKCPLFDNEDKLQFHCDACGICRIGGRNNFYHCQVCNMCFALRLIDKHTCLEDAAKRDCPVCMEDIHTSRAPVHVPIICGHLLHEDCFKRLNESGRNKCPVCQIEYI